MQHLFAYLLSICILVSPLVATPQPSTMNTQEILQELTNNMDESTLISMGLHLDLVNLRKAHKELLENLKQASTELNSSLLKIGSLETQVSSLQLQVTEAKDLSKNLNEGLNQVNLKSQKQETQIKTLRGIAIATTVLALVFGGIAIFK